MKSFFGIYKIILLFVLLFVYSNSKSSSHTEPYEGYKKDLTSGWQYSGSKNISIVPKSKKPKVLSKLDNDSFSKKIDDLIKNNWSIDNKIAIISHDYKIISESYDTSSIDQSSTPAGNSISKSVISMLVGLAYCEGKFNLDDKISNHVSDLKNTSWGQSTIRQNLIMSSGAYIAPTSLSGNASKEMVRDTFQSFMGISNLQLADLIKKYDSKSFTPGSQFSYSNADTITLGMIIAKSTNLQPHDYIKKMWDEIGANNDAHWKTNNQNETLSWAGFAAKPYDWVLLGHYFLDRMDQNDCFGNYLKEASKTQIDVTGFNQNSDYGYQIWTSCNFANDAFCFIGYYGQMLMLSPASKTVLYIHSTGNNWGGPNKWSLVFHEVHKNFIK